MPELKEVGAEEKSSFNLFDGKESTSICRNSETSADDTTGNQGEVFIIYYFDELNFNLLLLRPNFKYSCSLPPHAHFKYYLGNANQLSLLRVT